jgi:hypothetical protein
MDGREPAPAWFQRPPEVEANANRMRAFCPKPPAHRPTRGGKARLARRLTTILPAMTLAEAIETTRIHRVAGLTGDCTALVTNRPDCGSLCSSIAMRTGNGSCD